MYTMTAPQAAARLAATLVGYEIGLFGTTLVNAVLVLIVVTILVGALVAQQAVKRLPARRAEHRALGERVLVFAGADGPSPASLRAATRLTRPDGGHGRVVVLRTEDEPRLEPGTLRRLERQVARHGFDGQVIAVVDTLPGAVLKAVVADNPSVVVVDDPRFASPAPSVPIVVIDGADGTNGSNGWHVIGSEDDAAAIAQRLAAGPRIPRFRRPPTTPEGPSRVPSA